MFENEKSMDLTLPNLASQTSPFGKTIFNNTNPFKRYHKILKISPGAYIFQRPFLRGLFLEGFIYGGKFAFQNRLG